MPTVSHGTGLVSRRVVTHHHHRSDCALRLELDVQTHCRGTRTRSRRGASSYRQSGRPQRSIRMLLCRVRRIRISNLEALCQQSRPRRLPSSCPAWAAAPDQHGIRLPCALLPQLALTPYCVVMRPILFPACSVMVPAAAQAGAVLRLSRPTKATMAVSSAVRCDRRPERFMCLPPWCITENDRLGTTLPGPVN